MKNNTGTTLNTETPIPNLSRPLMKCESRIYELGDEYSDGKGRVSYSLNGNVQAHEGAEGVNGTEPAKKVTFANSITNPTDSTKQY